MIWADRRARTLTALALALGYAGTALAGPVVVRSTGPSARAYPAGRQLPDAATLALKKGDTIVLLDARGTRTVSGPGNFPAVGSGQRTTAASTAGRILANQTSSERRGGAVRGGTPSGVGEAPTIWVIDPTKAGTMCTPETQAPVFWRSNGSRDAVLRIAGPSGSGEVALRQGQTQAVWPAQMPVLNGSEYTLTLGAAAPAKVKLVTVNAGSEEETAAQLIIKGCDAQLERLITLLNRVGSAG